MSKSLMITVALFTWAVLGFFIISAYQNRNIEKKEVDLSTYDIATFAWGCFWCVESGFESQSWVIEVISWYSWWEEVDPTYAEVSSWNTWHRESV